MRESQAGETGFVASGWGRCASWKVESACNHRAVRLVRAIARMAFQSYLLERVQLLEKIIFSHDIRVGFKVLRYRQCSPRNMITVSIWIALTYGNSSADFKSNKYSTVLYQHSETLPCLKILSHIKTWEAFIYSLARITPITSKCVLELNHSVCNPCNGNQLHTVK